MSTRIEKIESQNFNGIPVECQIWDISRLYNVCASDLGRQNIAIDFQEYTGGKGIPCLEASNAINGNYKSYLCVIPGETLAAIYDKYGSLLLEGNVRSFLSTKVAVNKKIRETILKCPQNFFAYNNGIAATAMNLQIQNRESGLYITNAQDFQIINGGQTTASLSNAKFRDHANLDKIYVQMKLTEVEANDDESGELIRNISRSSNNQNKVSDADFFSTHPFHVRVEQLSRRFFAPAVAGNQYETKWFYERARGQYLQAQMKMTKAEQKKFKTQNPKKQVITKTDLAKVRNTWNEIPQIVSKGAQTNFIKFADMIDKEWDKSQLTYNEKYFKDSVALFILFKKTEALVSAQDWFKQGYRANIVTYSLALLHKLIREQFVNSDLDLQRIWLSQDVPNIVINELVKITKYVYDSIICPKTTANVTQWCKRDDCWKEIEKCQLKLSENMADVLLSKGDIANISRAARNDQNIVSEVEAQKLVVNKGPKYWLMVQKFVLAKRCRATELQLKALNYAIKIPLNIPSGLQSQKLLLLEEEVKANGFK